MHGGAARRCPGNCAPGSAFREGLAWSNLGGPRSLDPYGSGRSAICGGPGSRIVGPAPLSRGCAALGRILGMKVIPSGAGSFWLPAWTQVPWERKDDGLNGTGFYFPRISVACCAFIYVFEPLGKALY